jgi:hypothetical protein
MKVKIKDLVPNPYRDMRHYPIDPAKIESLKRSINQTGFWDNILARKRDGKFQIAYGHHRLVVLREVLKPTDAVDIPVKDLGDAKMLQIMANENMDEWATRPAVIYETVRVAKKFLKEHPDFSPRAEKYEGGYSKAALSIAKFLGWPEKRVYQALEHLGLIDQGILSKKAVEKMPTLGAARDLVDSVKGFKESGITVTPVQQERVAEKIIEEKSKKGRKPGEYTAQEEMIDQAIIREVHPSKKERAREKTYEEYLAAVVAKIRVLTADLNYVFEQREKFNEKFIEECNTRQEFITHLTLLMFAVKKYIPTSPKKELTR